MQYSDTTNKNGLLQRLEDYTQLGDEVITGDPVLKQKMTTNLNEALFELTTDIMLIQDDFDFDDPNKSDFPIATTPLVANQRDYQFDNLSFLKLKRVDVSYDGVNYVRAEALDSADIADGLGNDTAIDAKFSKTEPKYDPKSLGFWVYPRASAADVASGGKVRIEFSRAFDEFAVTDTNKQPPIDRNFHDLIAIGGALKWPGLSNKQFSKLSALYGERILVNGVLELTGGRKALVMHYSKRNEDSALSWGGGGLIPNYK